MKLKQSENPSKKQNNWPNLIWVAFGVQINEFEQWRFVSFLFISLVMR